MKKNLLLLGTVFFLITSLAFPLLGFALLEPSMVNLLFICLLFCMCVVGTYAFCDAWIKERREKSTRF
jgi:hypothetical protein